MTMPRVRGDLAYGAARPDDEPAIKALLAEGGLPTSDFTPELLAHFMVCRAADRVVGVAGLQVAGQAALLRSLAVSPGERGLGIGKELVRRAEAHARELGVDELYLLTTSAERFFAARGYRAVARESPPDAVRATAEFANLCPASSICMTKRLPA